MRDRPIEIELFEYRLKETDKDGQFDTKADRERFTLAQRKTDRGTEKHRQHTKVKDIMMKGI